MQAGWKPVQTGVILASRVVLYLQDYFLNKMFYIFLFIGRFTQDFLENLFSYIRFRQCIPHALAFKQNLKAITLEQFCEASKNSSFDQDDGELVDFLTATKERAAARKREESDKTKNNVGSIVVPQLSDAWVRRYVKDWELLVMYDMAGAVLHSLKENYSTCDKCFDMLLWKEKEPHPYATLTRINKYKEVATHGVSDECFLVLCMAELTFRMMRDELRDAKIGNIYELLLNRLQYLWQTSSVPNCHEIWLHYLRRFFTMRYRIYGQKRRAELDKDMNSRHRGSKSMAMHKTTK